MRLITLITLLHIVHAAYGQSPHVKQLLQQAETKKNKSEYAALLHKADTLAAGDMATQALINKKLGDYYFIPDPDKSIHHFRQAVSYYTILNDKPNRAIVLQNLAFAHDEGKFSIAEAIPYAEQALETWKELNDTLQMANMYKYLGLLQGKINRGVQAKRTIDTAIALYRAGNYENGVVVSWHNLAIVHQYRGQYDSAMKYIDMARNYWRIKDSSRLFELNNLAIEIGLAANNLAPAETAYNENLALLNEKYFWRDRIVFYTQSINYLRRAGKEKEASLARDKYNALYEDLKKKGLIRSGG
ncbi:hypothetical protein [Polluticoccus soli]|uniref:hypothetical protein n=1 Tax=Polluticoccus soli TaxID=3034150 RepID=UPI0023E29858|nr:hypothetical protein [Flavipsychrobacter sp. JY13-12]